MQAAETPRVVRANVRKLDELPALPQNTERLLAVLGSDDIDLKVLAQTIEEVPSLAARIVGLANSAYFGSPGQIASVADAIIRVLGLKLVRNLSMGIVVGNSLKTDQCPAFNTDHYWAGSLLCAGMARSLAASVRAEPELESDSAYLCGLLHNLGLLILVHVAPEEMTKALEIAAEQPDRSLTLVEQELMGMDHTQAGAWLAYRWQLPGVVTTVIGHHRQPEYRGAHWLYSMFVGLCARWARQRLAGVESPWVAPQMLAALGIEQAVLEANAEACSQSLEEIVELGKLLSGSS